MGARFIWSPHLSPLEGEPLSCWFPGLKPWASIYCPSGTKNHHKQPLFSRHSGLTMNIGSIIPRDLTGLGPLRHLGVSKVIVVWRYISVVIDRCLNQCRSVTDPPGGFKSRAHLLCPRANEPGPAARFSKADKINRGPKERSSLRTQAQRSKATHRVVPLQWHAMPSPDSRKAWRGN